MERQRSVRLGRCLFILAAPVAIVLAAAPPAQAETRLSVDAGWDGRYRPGQPIPVRVEISADRLIQGNLVVSADDGTEVTLPVEVPGGSVKEYLVVVPTATTDDDVTVRAAVAAGDERAEGESDVEYEPTVDLVGLTGSLAPAETPAPLDLAPDAGTASFVEVSDDELALPGTLAALGSLVIGPDDLGRLPETARTAVVSWVAAGGRLLVDAEPGTPVAGLPDAWLGEGADRVVAELGEVRFTAGAAAAGRWEDVVEPTPNLSGQTVDEAASAGIGLFPVSDTIARDAGLRLTTPGWLLGFLIVYVVLAGPVTWFVLRAAKRPGLAWVVIPVVAVVFAAASFVVGRDLRAGTQAAHGTVVFATDGGATAMSYVGAVSKNGGDSQVLLPPGWAVSTVDQSWFGLGTERLAVSLSGSGPEATIRLDAGEFGVLRSEGAMAVEGGLVVEAAASGDDVVSGTVRNTTSMSMNEVAVIMGHAGTNVGSLEPGESTTWEIDSDRLGFPIGEPVEAQVWPRATGWNAPPDPDSDVSLALWSEAQRRYGPNFLSAGSVVAAGWTRDLDVPARADGDELDGRALLLDRAAISPPEGGFHPAAVRLEVLRSGNGADDVMDDLVAERRGEFRGHHQRLTLPGGPPPADLELVVGPDVSAVQVWRGAEWDTIDDSVDDDTGAGRVGGDRRSIALPADSVVDGVIHVRTVTNTFFGPPMPPRLTLDVAEVTP